MLRQKLLVRPMDVGMDAVPRALAAYETTHELGRPSTVSVMPAGAQMARSPDDLPRKQKTADWRPSRCTRCNV
jgi:hypothetical protein